MTYQFLSQLPNDLPHKPILISGEGSAELPRAAYLLVDNDGIEMGFEIRYACHCSPFREALVAHGVLAVGFEGYFYLFDLAKNEHVLSLELDGYFGGLYYNDNLFYVADAHGLYCLDKSGDVLWQRDNLAVDGLTIGKFEAGKIYGRAEMDPPGGWRDFILDWSTGLEPETGK